MKTSTAEKNRYVCPRCGDNMARDHAGLGFVRHKNNPNCDFERGERDKQPCDSEDLNRQP